MPTFSTSQNGSENINFARWSRTHIACQKRLHPVKLLPVYDYRAELVIISAAPVIHASVQLFFQHTPKRGVTPVHAVCFPDITDSSPLGNCVFKIIKSVLHNGCVFRYDFQPLFFIHTEAERSRAGNNGAVCNLTVKYNVYSFTSMSASFCAMDSFTLIYRRPFAVVVSYSSSVVFQSQLCACNISMTL